MRTRRFAAGVESGQFVVDGRLAGATLELRAAATRPERLDELTCRLRVVAADRLGRWQLAGSYATGNTLMTCFADVTYHGVYCQGAWPVAWLTITATATPNGTDVLRPVRRILIGGDINLEAPTALDHYTNATTERRAPS